MIKMPWYDDRVMNIACNKKATVQNENYTIPLEIYNYLNKTVWKQENAKKAASLIVWKMSKGIKENAMFVGPSGCGKTEIWRQLQKLYPDRIVIVDASHLTMDGWKGSVKWNNLLESPVFCENKNTILVMDEADKMLSPKYSSTSENVSHSVMSEGLKILEGTTLDITINQVAYKINTENISFVLLGAFSKTADDIAEKKRCSSIGFGARSESAKPYSEPLTEKDIVDFGVLPEFMGRINKLVNLEPLTENDFEKMLTDSSCSPVRKLEEKYNIKLKLSGEKIQELSKIASESGLGTRAVNNRLVQMVDDILFDNNWQRYLEL